MIGAGCSGLTALKALREEGLDPVGFEMGKDVGGLWVLRNSNGRGGAYRSLHINTSTKASEFSDFPMKADIGDFPHHAHMAEYLRDYAAHFRLTDSIAFDHEVLNCLPLSTASGEALGYWVTVFDHGAKQKKQEFFDAVVVANGHHFAQAFPRPNPASSFGGTVFHSGDYLDPHSPHNLIDRDVVVVGIGNSAVDIACELSRPNGARKVVLSCRRGAWVLPKFLLGRPIDERTLIPRWLPDRLRRWIATRSFEFLFGKMSDYGLPDPDHLIGEAHPTISEDLPALVKAGRIAVAPLIERCEDERVYFCDGSVVHADAIVFCTGYDLSFSFFEPDHVRVIENSLPLYLRAFHLEHRRVFFVGLLQTVGAVMPSAEVQAQLIARHVSGKYNLPPLRDMRADVERHERRMKKRFVSSRRHTMQVIPEDFIPQVKRELARGEKRANAGRGIAFFPSAEEARNAAIRRRGLTPEVELRA